MTLFEIGGRRPCRARAHRTSPRSEDLPLRAAASYRKDLLLIASRAGPRGARIGRSSGLPFREVPLRPPDDGSRVRSRSATRTSCDAWMFFHHRPAVARAEAVAEIRSI